MERRSRRKSRYTLVLIAEKGDGTMNKHAMNSAVFGVFAAIFFVSFIVLACKTVYDSIIIKDIREEVVGALVNLGYKVPESRKAVEKCSPNDDFETVLKNALQFLSGKK